MNRRQFLKTTGVVAGFVSVSVVGAEALTIPETNKWWSEQHEMFENIPCVFYDWPKDRMISLTCSGDQKILISTFDLRETSGDIYTEIRKVISCAQKENKSLDPYLHVFKIKKLDNEYAICCTNGDASVTTDFHAKTKTSTYSISNLAPRLATDQHFPCDFIYSPAIAHRGDRVGDKSWSLSAAVRTTRLPADDGWSGSGC